MSSLLGNIAGKKLGEHIIFSTSVAEDSSPRATALAARVRERFPTMTAFVAAAQSYDGVMVLASAIKVANSTDGAAVAAALETKLPDTQGVIKMYQKPFAKGDHEGLGVADFHLARWRDGKVIAYKDAITANLKAEDYKK
jgi:branched-chain amino acid transport system substrate-binding protein